MNSLPCLSKRLLLFPCALILTVLSFSAQAAEEGHADLVLEIEAPKGELNVGAHANFNAILHNKGKETLTLVLPGDGSSVGWRTPVVKWNADPVDGKMAPLPLMARCGNINGFNAKEIFILKPGDRKELGGWAGGPRFTKAGKHRIQLTYENDPNLPMKGLAPKGAGQPYAAVKKTTAVKVISNVLTVEVKPGKAPLIRNEAIEIGPTL